MAVALAYTLLGFALGVSSVGIYLTLRLRQLGYYSWEEVETLFHKFVRSDVVAQVCHRRQDGVPKAGQDWWDLYWFLKMAAHFLPTQRRRNVQDHLESVLNHYGLPMSFLDDGEYRRANDHAEDGKPWPMAKPNYVPRHLHKQR
ncbi:MAG: hypothetical protein A3F33_00360 [Candidatus Woykebacteria bacterium RIFCSPHIGHO2_12_FULL_43_10]|nr:MAG: hypothetical protein A3F33_00360 [Candidatus Woykebacteria bacterium RIFCSPHIGHO2_12_FULL_43_10]OGY32833.1 MAG: hypothetical protein A3A61_01990 [Candidatus Woykebacteria bacterium RIFCSPLOWO2_01_FULL_43_14]